MRAAFVALVAAAIFVCVGCFGGGAQTPAQSSVQVRAEARAVVSLAADTWNGTAEACMAVAEAKQDDTVRQKCAAILLPMHATIEAAADAVDSWDAAQQQNFPCMAADIVAGLLQIEQLLPQLGIQAPPLIADAVTLAKTFAPSCPNTGADGGLLSTNPYGAQ